ncbi:hypothetical protein [Flavobacterium phragmitis]|uniref:Uncharacterized protein n=1 Tax=Flavobacterium phragmitis TaxID=739143 RepID=A0A1I1R066_9FLAO|nr:hypothetical protein [Flavobacterium phragmitis]SFD27719.1 hypothetical protein SAMN05216297_106182 [Flavobacterium phragmitis]
MRNFIWSILLFTSAIFTCFSQTKDIEKGTYLSTNKGQKIKLNLLDDNKYELVFYSGDYIVKGDSLLFAKNTEAQTSFDLSFKVDKKAKNIKVKFLDPSYYSFYIGTQKGKEEVKYQRLSDIKSKVDPDWAKTDLEFEIEKADFLYLVYEEYGGKSSINKYALPKDVSEVTINYELAVLGDLQIAGFFDRSTNELKISEKSGLNPLVFINEKDPQPAKKTAKVLPLESLSVANWTYPGKENTLLSDDFGTGLVATDSVATAADYAVPPPAYTRYDFKLKIENSLKKAIDATKGSSNKFLVVYADSNTKSAKESFDAIVKEQETQTGYNMYDKYVALYDVYNFYLAGADDKKWLKTNKIANDPSVLVLNREGNIIASAKSDLTAQQYQFGYYSEFYRQLLRADALISINNAVKNKKATDADLIKAFNKAALLETSYDYDTAITVDPNSTEFVITKTTLDKKEVNEAWKKIIESHQKDKAVNMYLAETIVKEIKNQGFTKQLFNEDKILSDTDFLAIDYLLKHSEDIESNREAFNSKEGELHTLGNVVSEISNALQQNVYASQDGVTGEINKEKVNSIYKKIIESGKGNFEAYKNYFDYLSMVEDKDTSNTTYLREFNTYFDTNLAGGSPIEKLDAIYSTLDSSSNYSYDGWNAFKDYHSNLCNNAAWTVVTKAQNSSFLKDAIKWSEYSLVVTKNNPYYLDTLAQLYYKDGQKEKAIATQTLAVKYLDANMDGVTATDIKETLAEMQNGTY